MKIGVVADDLTGANATGVRLNKQGFTSATVVFNRDIPKGNKINAVCIDTDTRYARDDVIVKRINSAIKKLDVWGADVISKRIDSTVRGNIGLEIDTALDIIGEKSVAIVVPSFPDSGRVVSGGYMLVNGNALQFTDVANDPVRPIKSSCVPTLIKNQSKNKVTHICLSDVLEGTDNLRKKMERSIMQENRIIVIDAISNEDINIIAKSMAEIKDTFLIPVDPGPLTAVYATVLSQNVRKQSKIIVTVGSITDITHKQIEYLKSRMNSVLIHVSAEKLASFQSDWEKEVMRVTNKALEKIHKEDVLIITTNKGEGGLIDIQEIADKEDVVEDAIAKRITDGLAKITRQVVEHSEVKVGGCFTSGGDVTASLCAVTMASGIKLEDEILPLVAYGTLLDGHLPYLPIITKGGMVGETDAIYQSVKYLKTKISRSE